MSMLELEFFLRANACIFGLWTTTAQMTTTDCRIWGFFTKNMCSPKMHLSQNYIKTNTEENVPDFGFVDKNKTYENQFPFHFELAASK